MKLAWLLLCLALAAPAYAVAPAFDPFAETGIDPQPNAAAPLERIFTDETGARVTLTEIARDKPILLVPVLHDCPNICGVTLQGMAQAIAAQNFRPGRDFTLIAFGIDPREKPESAARSLRDLGKAFPSLLASGGMHALTGSEEDIRSVTNALGYRYAFNAEVGQYSHLAATAVLSREGRLARWLFGLSPEPVDLRLALTEAGEGLVGTIADKLLLLCYHYDPVTGRYGPLVWTMLRVGGSTVALVLGGFILTALVRERRRGAGVRS
ncbi:MAG: SCO family protein [Methylobacterium mesophilicum]|nr:SCO family protein [Methylobacterium mesophilicum]